MLEEHSDLDTSNNVVLALQSDNIDQDISKLKANGITFLHDPKPCPPGRFTTLTDPNGNINRITRVFQSEQVTIKRLTNTARRLIFYNFL
ncbi:VOC family protein [Piscibacillus sp. B03]|uniref:VOC family protein n=1 Tax=Piscibacillus sp. B03 TaxID=3457430 RepID=UPI003FCEC036